MSAISLTSTIGRQLLDRPSTTRWTWAERIEAVLRHSLRYSLVVVLLWIGGMKFTAYEAEGISGFVANSPLMGWAYSLFSVQGFSALLGARKGEYEHALDDEPVTTYKAGDTFYEPSGSLHRVARNSSGTTRTRLLAVVLHSRDTKETTVQVKGK